MYKMLKSLIELYATGKLTGLPEELATELTREMFDYDNSFVATHNGGEMGRYTSIESASQVLEFLPGVIKIWHKGALVANLIDGELNVFHSPVSGLQS